MNTDEKYMFRALELAKRGASTVHPNPMVGAVVVHNDKIIGEGFHQEYGQPHAEVNAIADVEDQELLKRSTLYVNLEPCSHYGKTPPCSDLIINKGIPKVVVANLDPNPAVAGTGLKNLAENGVHVNVGVLEEEGNELNRRFFNYHRSGLPFITLKWAQTADGFIGRLQGGTSSTDMSKRISNPSSDVLVHKLRSEHDGILIGTETFIQDDPGLNNRLWPGPSPTAIIMSNSIGDIEGSKLATMPQKTIIIPYGDTKMDLEKQLKVLGDQGIQQILVEGGRVVLQSFIDHQLWNEAFVITSKTVWSEGVSAPVIEGQKIDSFRIGNDEWIQLRKWD